MRSSHFLLTSMVAWTRSISKSRLARTSLHENSIGNSTSTLLKARNLSWIYKIAVSLAINLDILLIAWVEHEWICTALTSFAYAFQSSTCSFSLIEKLLNAWLGAVVTWLSIYLQFLFSLDYFLIISKYKEHPQSFLVENMLFTSFPSAFTLNKNVHNFLNNSDSSPMI